MTGKWSNNLATKALLVQLNYQIVIDHVLYLKQVEVVDKNVQGNVPGFYVKSKVSSYWFSLIKKTIISFKEQIDFPPPPPLVEVIKLK